MIPNALMLLMARSSTGLAVGPRVAMTGSLGEVDVVEVPASVRRRSMSPFVARRGLTEPLPPELNYVTDGGADLGECEGGCGSDSDCREGLGLRCYKRWAYETVPGCAGGGDSDVNGVNYCSRVPENYLFWTGNSLGTDGYGLCEGDCDEDSSCRGDLICVQRERPDGYVKVPGCDGMGRLGSDYCGSLPSPSLVSTSSTPSICDGIELVINVTTDNYPSEISWTLVDNCDIGIKKRSDPFDDAGELSSRAFCLPPANYTFSMDDSYGDGICCVYGDGLYEVFADGVKVAEGAEFGATEETSFGSCPTPEPSLSPSTPPPTPCSGMNVEVNVFTDDYPEETTWSLINKDDGTEQQSGGPYFDRLTLYTYADCLPASTYIFVIRDSYEDGICCIYGQGYYRVLVDGNLVAEGSDFGDEAEAEIGSINVTPVPTENPTLKPSSQPVPTSPSEAPTAGPTTQSPTNVPTKSPLNPTKSPSVGPSGTPTQKPITNSPSEAPTARPMTENPTLKPSPSLSPSVPPTIPCSGMTVEVNIFTDDYPEETTWSLTNKDDGTEQGRGGPYTGRLTLYTYAYCLTASTYIFVIRDSYEDGMCCNYGQGFFRVLVDGNLVAEGSDFGDEAEAEIGSINMVTPSEKPSLNPSDPGWPTLVPSLLPSSSSKPSAEPSDKPTIVDSMAPSSSSGPSSDPSTRPSLEGPNGPSESIWPTSMPSPEPSARPSLEPTSSKTPSEKPSLSPSETGRPTLAPSLLPSSSSKPSPKPSHKPTLVGSLAPSSTSLPSRDPSTRPSLKGTDGPSVSIWPTSMPSPEPSIRPSLEPTSSKSPSERPSLSPSETGWPTLALSLLPSSSLKPSAEPSHKPTLVDSMAPSSSSRPSSDPSSHPSLMGSNGPSVSIWPTSMPSPEPSVRLSLEPTSSKTPSERPSLSPSETGWPTLAPSLLPSSSPNPSTEPSHKPTLVGSLAPSSSSRPSSDPSARPSLNGSNGPSESIWPTSMPSPDPSVWPSLQPTSSKTPSEDPSLSPSETGRPTLTPSLLPSSSSKPSAEPSHAPTLVGSLAPSSSSLPSREPSTRPSLKGSNGPSVSIWPTSMPSPVSSSRPSLEPTSSKAPSERPSLGPSETTWPTLTPSLLPSSSLQPSSEPSHKPTLVGSLAPSSSSRPSSDPSTHPSLNGSNAPSVSIWPTSMPSPEPSVWPSLEPTSSKTPSEDPSLGPSETGRPTLAPSLLPSSSSKPSAEPSQKPTLAGSLAPSSLSWPSSDTSSRPSLKGSNWSPTASPTAITKPTESLLWEGDTRAPSTDESTSSPTSPPSMRPTNRLTGLPTKSPSKGIASFPSMSPSLDCPLTMDPPTDGPALEISGTGPPYSLCQGGCSGDSDCKLGLTCYKTYKNGPFTVPGCSGSPELLTNYCTIVPENYLNFVDGSAGTGQLVRCEGGCDSDSQCGDGLVCFLRGRGTNNPDVLTPVPGCCGLGRRNADYCIDPKDDPSFTLMPSLKPSASRMPMYHPSSNPSETDWRTEPPSFPPSFSTHPTPISLQTLVPAPLCVNDPNHNYTCLQTSDFGVNDPSNYNIDLSLEMLDTSNADAYISARDKWLGIVIGDRPSKTSSMVPSKLNNCINDLPAVIDDLYICGRDLVIDGPYGILGRAGPRYIQCNNGACTTVTGIMAFDADDIERLAASGRWENVIIHEMGHVIGVGSLWAYNNVVNDDLGYLGEKGINVWKNDWGCSSNAPPVETDFGSGTRGSHWDEECLQDELMTGFASQPGVEMPLSKLTVATLEDIGYDVNYTAADTYDGSDTTCCFSGLISSAKLRKPRLSKQKHDVAVAYGREVLSKSHQPQDPGDQAREDGLIYVGDRFVAVLIEENGIIFDVHVTSE